MKQDKWPETREECVRWLEGMENTIRQQEISLKCKDDMFNLAESTNTWLIKRLEDIRKMSPSGYPDSVFVVTSEMSECASDVIKENDERLTDNRNSH